MKLLGAIKSINITPPIGINLAGYSDRSHGAEGIKDELFAKTLVLSDGKEKIVLVTTDLTGIDYNFTKNVRKLVEKNSNIKGQNIMITASHTHSGPSACKMESNYAWMNIGNSEMEISYYKLLIEAIARLIIWANNSLQEIKIGFDKGLLTNLGSNRRDPNKPFDSEVNVLRIDDENNQPIAAVVNYSCHPTVLSAENYLISGDFPSYMMKGISRFYQGCEAMFAQGAAGDISTRHTRRESSFNEAKRMGEMLAGESIKVLNKVYMTNRLDIKSLITPIKIPIREFDSDDECIQRIEDAKRNLNKLKKEGAPANIIRSAEVILQGAEKNYMIKKDLKIKEFNTEMQLIQLGDNVIISIPGELFNKIGTKIKKLTEKYNIIVAGYANDYIGYILDSESYTEESYESGASMVSHEAEKIIVDAAEKLITMIE